MIRGPPWRVLHQKDNVATDAIHIYRGLLRATTYLPDSNARKYVEERIKTRFRSSGAKTQIKSRDAPADLQSPVEYQKKFQELTRNRLRQAHRIRRTLQAAGEGDLDALKKVLLYTHGRIGERRHVLLKDLLRPDEDTLPKDDQALQELIKTGKQAEKHVPSLKLYSFIRSQQENQPTEAHKEKIRQLKVKIPKEDVWGRSLPLKVAASIRRKWWATTLEKVFPPVPRGEWDRLGDIALGKVPLEELVKFVLRRATRVTPEGIEAKTDTATVLDYLNGPARETDSEPTSLTFEERKGLVVSTVFRELATANINTQNTKAERHLKESSEASKRSVRRLYSAIWNLTSTMSYNEETKHWDIQWGGQKSRALEGVLSQPTVAQKELFEGIDKLPERDSGPIKSKWQLKRSWKRAREKDEAAVVNTT